MDYDYQRNEFQDPERVHEVDQCAAKVIDAAEEIGATVIVVSEYGLVPVSRPVHINRILRKLDRLCIRKGPFGEMLIPGECSAFAVSDHQLAHVYVRDPNDIPRVRSELESVPGISQVISPGELSLDHSRAGELIALAEDDSWFTYYYWLDDTQAPDFARSVDIHRKPGYDPCELFITSRFRAIGRVAQKKLGFRYRMDVIPLDANLVKGSHGLRPAADKGPLIIGPEEPPDDMREFKSYLERLMKA